MPASRVTSGGYGHRVDASIAYACLPVDVEVGEQVEVGVSGMWVPAVVAVEPLYGPEYLRVRTPPR
ncbi:glycine cleavage T C-terminal barrel domain-containing protein [Sinosporangium album]|uniref:glycine cleavage T C-terminal barrel domain-containing protein n=1 Tax=Sinosporangium album TaxID=504805 RepID=UPI001FE07F9C|nr:glycine cleavage T C-terminal barrel domain-containing protein [Sinosporangium album]